MNIPYMAQDSLNEFKANLEIWAPKFCSNTNTWIGEVFDKEIFLKTKYEVDDLKLEISVGKSAESEVNNIKLVYEKLRFLSDSQATDERLWAALCLGPCWNYVQNRWNIQEKCTATSIEQHYFFGYGPRRSLTRNAIARLWWIGRLTYDVTLNDPYELTKFICEDADYVTHILERNTSNNPMIIREFIKAIIEARKNGVKISEDDVRELSKYLNLLGGIYILDCLPEGVIFSKISEKIVRLHSVTN